MDSKVDPKGFELQDTSPPSADAVVKNGEKKPSTPAEPSQMSQRSSNGKPPPKPSKSSTLPSRNGLTNMSSNIENGPIDKAAEAQGKERLQLNVGYFKSWQAWLKIVKMLCLLAMLITLATSLSGITAKLPRISLYKPIWESLRTLRFGVALAVMGLVIEVTFFMIYLIGANSIITKHINLGVALIVCHSLMLLLTFAAPIALNVKKWTGPSVTCFIAFDMTTIAGYALEVYFNISWLRKGSELNRLPCF